MNRLFEALEKPADDSPFQWSKDTTARTLSGAGHQHFIEFMGELVRITEPKHLDAALFETWTYGDERPDAR